MFEDYLKAGYPLLWVQTYEPDRLIGDMAEGEVSKLRSIRVWDCNRGFRVFDPESGWSPFVSIDDSDPYEMPDIMAKSERSLWVLQNYHWFMAEPKVKQGLLNNLGIYKAKFVTVMIVSPDARVNDQVGVPKEIDRELTILTYGLPSKDDLGIILNDMMTDNEVRVPEDAKNNILESAQGLT